MPATSVGDLFGRMIMDASRFEQGINRSDRALQQMERSVGRAKTSTAQLDTSTQRVERTLSSLGVTNSRTAQTFLLVSRGAGVAGAAIAVVATAATLATAAVVGLAVAMGTRLLKSVVSVGSFAENARLQLDAILGSAEQGARAFELLNREAAALPQTLQEIISGAGSLGAAAGGSADELARLVRIAADIQATFPQLTFQEVAANLQRAMTAGIASAELFRERGISAMLGFQAGATVSAQETRDRIVHQWEQGTNNMVGATERMASTFTGIVSMLEDAWFRFRLKVGEAGTFDAVKDGLDEVRQALDRLEESGALGQLAQTASDLMVPAIEAASAALVTLLDWVERNQQAIREWGAVAAAEIQIAASALANLATAFFHLSEAMFSTGQVIGAILRKDFQDAAGHAADLRSELRAMVGDLEDIGGAAESAFARILRVTGGLDVFQSTMQRLFGGAAGGRVEPTIVATPTGGKAAKVKTDPFQQAIERLAQGRREIAALEDALAGTSVAFDATAERAKLLETSVRSIASLDLSDPQRAQLNTLIAEWLKYETAVQDSEAAIRRLQETLRETPADPPSSAQRIMARDIELARAKFEQESARMESAADNVASSIGDSFASIVTQSRSFVDAFRSVVDAIIAEVVRLTVVREVAGFIASLLGTNVIPGRPVEVPGPPLPRQHGGPLSAGQLSIVGERGPELFVPRSAGTVVPNGGSFGGRSEIHHHTHNSYDIRALDSRGVRQVLEQHAGTLNAVNRRQERLRGRG